MVKRSIADVLEEGETELDGELEATVERLKDLCPDAQLAVMAKMHHLLEIDPYAFKRVRTDVLSSLSERKWSDLAPRLGLPANIETMKRELGTFAPPMCMLPPSLLESMYKNGWQNMDVYQEKVDQVKEAARAKLLDPILVPILAIFQGRIVDTPEYAMSATEYSSGSCVEHKIITIGGVVFFVVEFKVRHGNSDYYAQIFLELLSAAKANSLISGYENIRIYGLLTDLTVFEFYSYSPSDKKFSQNSKRYLTETTRGAFLASLIPICNVIFSIVMAGYMETLKAAVPLSRWRTDAGDPGSSIEHQREQALSVEVNTQPEPASQEHSEHSTHLSLTAWESGLAIVEGAYTTFQECVSLRDVEELEQKSMKALQMLMKSARSIPRFDPIKYSGPKSEVTVEVLNNMAAEAVKNWVETRY